MNRRTFVQRMSTAALAGMSLGYVGCEPQQPMETETPVTAMAGLPGSIGVQLYTLRSLMADDFAGTLQQVADIGYKNVEFAGYYDNTPTEVKALLNDLGLAACSGHFGANVLQEDADTVIEGASTLGMTYVIAPSLPREQRADIDGYKAAAAWFNEIGEKCKAAGHQFAYHNHSFEFEEMDGQIPYDILLDESDPDLVKMQLDLFWIVNAGHDPLAYFERNPGRFALCHVKDRTANEEMTAVGQGIIDFPAIFAQGEEAGLEYLIVEHDNPEDPIQSITTSFTYLKSLNAG